MVSARVPGEPFSAAETVAGRRDAGLGQFGLGQTAVEPERPDRLSERLGIRGEVLHEVVSPLVDIRDGVIPGIIRDSVNLRRRGGVCGRPCACASSMIGR